MAMVNISHLEMCLSFLVTYVKLLCYPPSGTPVSPTAQKLASGWLNDS